MVRLRDRIGLNVPPLFLRVTLGIVFIWAGLGKISDHYEVTGQSAATLANMGVIDTLPGSPKPAETPKDAKPADSPAPEAKPSGASLDRPGVTLARFQSKIYTAADFPTTISVKRVYGLAVAIHDAADPAPAADGSTPLTLWPKSLARGSLPVYLAWAVALTELCGGVSLVLGLLTRLWALGIAGVMLGALWLTEIGPAIQMGNARFGFLPGYAPFDTSRWERPLFQLALLGAALALAFCGPGRLSLDNALLGGRGEEDDD